MVENIILDFLLMFLMFFPSDEKVEWKVKEQISKFGEDLELFCKIYDNEISSTRSKRWHGGPNQKLLALNGHVENSTKYKATFEENGFSLIIKKFTKNDLNVTYQCNYGFQKSKNLLLQGEDVFRVEWKVKEQISKFGEDLELFCKAYDYEISSTKSKRWHGGPNQKLLALNGAAENSTKYKATVENNGFSLIIKKLTKNDLNVTYQCNYGFHKSVKLLLQEKDVFRGFQINEGMNVVYNSKTYVIVLCVAVGLLVIVVSILIVKLHRSRKIEKKEEDIQLLHMEKHLLEKDQELLQSVNIDVTPDDTDGDHVSSKQTLVQLDEDLSFKKEASVHKSEKFPAYSKPKVREQSFTEWSLSQPTIQRMSHAGFFYKGCNTYAQCFFCGMNRKWKENENPLSDSLHYGSCGIIQVTTDYTAETSNSTFDLEQPFEGQM